MKILVVSQYFWPEGFRINDIVRTLTERGHDVEVLTGKPNYPRGALFDGYRASGCQSEVWQGATILRVPLVPRGADSAVRLGLNYLSFVVSGLLFGSWLCRKRKYDVIFVYGLSPILLAIPGLFQGWLKRLPVVLWVQDLWPESLEATGYVKNRMVLNLVGKVVQYIYRHADLLLGQSRAFVDEIARMAPGKQVLYYPNSVDGDFAVPASSPPPDIPGLECGFTVVFAGNIGAAQAVDVIVDAAEKLREYHDIRFIVIGDGSRREWMQREVQSRGLTNCSLPGRFPVETMPAVMQRASALLVTLTDQPIFAVTVPNKVQAYMAAGRPILACLNGEGARIVCEAGAGLAVAAEDAAGLADAILQLYRLSPAERDQMGLNGRSYFREHFDHEMLVGRLIDMLHDVHNNPGGML